MAMTTTGAAGALTAILGSISLGYCGQYDVVGNFSEADGNYTLSNVQIAKSGTITPTPTPTEDPAIIALKAKLKSHLNDLPPGLMENPPLITAGQPNAASSFAGYRNTAWNSGAYRYVGVMAQAGTGFPDRQFGSNQEVSYSLVKRSSNRLIIRFQTDAPAFEISMKGTGALTKHRLIVDGQYASKENIQYPNNGSGYLTKVDFQGLRRRRDIAIETYGMFFRGIYTDPAEKIEQSAPGDPVRAVFVGDSFTEAYSSYAQEAGRLLGWEELHSSGVGGTGYISHPDAKLTFRERMQHDVYDLNPEVVVMAGGVNDAGKPGADMPPELKLLFDEISAKLPNTIVFVLGAWSPHSCCNRDEEAIRSEALKHKNFYFVPVKDWLLGTGNVTAPTNATDVYISGDDIHPTSDGHAYLAGKVTTELKRIIAGF